MVSRAGAPPTDIVLQSASSAIGMKKIVYRIIKPRSETKSGSNAIARGQRWFENAYNTSHQFGDPATPLPVSPSKIPCSDF